MPGNELIKKITDLFHTDILEDPPEERLEPDENLFEKGYISSLEILELVEAIEAEFKISIPHYEVSPENFETIRRIANYLQGKLSD